jgi:hypothetical protein
MRRRTSTAWIDTFRENSRRFCNFAESQTLHRGSELGLAASVAESEDRVQSPPEYIVRDFPCAPQSRNQGLSHRCRPRTAAGDGLLIERMTLLLLLPLCVSQSGCHHRKPDNPYGTSSDRKTALGPHPGYELQQCTTGWQSCLAFKERATIGSRAWKPTACTRRRDSCITHRRGQSQIAIATSSRRSYRGFRFALFLHDGLRRQAGISALPKGLVARR